MHCRAHSKTTGDGRFKLSVLRLTPSPEWEAGRKGASRSDRERASAGLLQSRSPRTLPMTPSTSVARLAASLPVAPGFAATGQAILAAANLILPDLERGRAIDARDLRAAMATAFHGSDAEDRQSVV